MIAGIEKKVADLDTKMTLADTKLNNMDTKMANMDVNEKLNKMEANNNTKIANTDTKLETVNTNVANMQANIEAVNNEMRGMRISLNEMKDGFDYLKEAVLEKIESKERKQEEITKDVSGAASGGRENKRIFVAGGSVKKSVEIFNYCQRLLPEVMVQIKVPTLTVSTKSN